METWMIIAIGVAAVAAILVIAGVFIAARQRRNARQTTQLQEGFGPEYAKAVEDQGRSGAEQDLLKRQERANLFPVRTLSAIEVDRYTRSWTSTQAHFVDEPGEALTAADHLVGEVVVARGYPAAEFEQGASALSVDHPRAVQAYRAAHDVVLKNQRNPVPTDDLRAAMMQYHEVFSELVDGAVAAEFVATN